MNDIERIIKMMPTESYNMATKGHIVTRIREEKIRRAKMQAYIFGTLSVLGVLSLIPSIIYLVYEISTSSLGEYFALIFSDADVVATHLYPFVMSLIDSTPFVGMILTLSTLALTISFYRKLSEGMTAVNYYKLFKLNS